MLKHMRTTLNIDDALMKRVRSIAAAQGKTITQVIEEALRRELSGQKPEQRAFSLSWVTVSGRLRPGVDLSDRDALYEKMEERG